MVSKLNRKPNTCVLAAKVWGAMHPLASSFRARLGLFFFVVNFPFGYGGLAVSSALAAATKEPRWLIAGTTCYVLSWVMLGLAIIFLGADTVAFLRSSGRRKWRAWKSVRQQWNKQHIEEN